VAIPAAGDEMKWLEAIAEALRKPARRNASSGGYSLVEIV
jgi:hypothetical protein